MSDGDELKITSYVLEALRRDLRLAPTEGAEPPATAVLAASIDTLAREFGLAPGNGRVQLAIPPSARDLLNQFVGTLGSDLDDEVVRDALWDELTKASDDSALGKVAGKITRTADALLAFSVIYWNLQLAPDETLAGLDLKNRGVPAGYKMDKSGTAFYRQGARIAVLLADRMARDKEPPPVGRARFRSTSTGNRVAWSIVWPAREHVDTRRPSGNAVEPGTHAGLTSRAFALAAITPATREKVAPGISAAAPVVDDEALKEVVANEARRIISELSRPASLTEMSTLLIRSLGHDAKRAWAKPKSFKAFLADAVPTVRIFSDGTGWVVPEGVTPDPPLLDPWFAAPRLDDDPALRVVVDDVRRIVGEFTRPAKLVEVSALLTRALGDDAKRARDEFRSFMAFLEYAVPTAQIISDARHGQVVLPEGFSPDQPLPDTWFSAPLIDDDPTLTQTVISKTRQIIGQLTRPAKLQEVAALLTGALGEDAKRTWAKYKTLDAYLAYAVPTAKILTDPRHGRVVLPDLPLPDTWFEGPLIDDDPALAEDVANEARRIIGELSRPASLTEMSTLLIRSLGPDAKRAWARYKSFKSFLESAVPTAQILTDPRHGQVVLPDQPLPDTWFEGPLIDDDPALTEVVANEARRIIGELSRPASLTEMSTLLIRSLGPDAKWAWAKYKSFKSFLESAVPTAQILTDPRHGQVVLPEGVPPDQPLPETWFATPLIDDDPALTQTVTTKTRQIIGELSRPAKLPEVSALLTGALGEDAKRTWAKYKTIDAFLAYAVPTAKILTDPRHGRVVFPEGASPDQPLPDTWFATPLIDDDPALTEVVANEARRIISERSHPATLPEVLARLNWSLGEDAKRTLAKFKSLKAFVEYAVPSAQIVSDHPPGWVYPEGVPLDHPRPDSWFAVPGDHDHEALTEIVANEAGRIVGELTQPTKLLTLSGQLIRSLGPDAKRAWAKPKNFKTFLAHAVPTAQIFSDGTGWLVPEGVTPDPQLLDPWFATPRLEDDETLTAVVNEAHRIVGELSRPATLPEVLARLNWSLGEDAKRTLAKFKSLKAFVEYAVPSAQIVSDHPPGWVYPEGVPLDHPRPDSWFAVPGDHDHEALTEIVANEAGRIVGELTQPTKLLTLSGQLIRSLGPDAKRAWAKPKNFKTFLAHAVPTAQIFSDGTGWLVPEGVTPDPQLLDPWLPPDPSFTEGLVDDDPALTERVSSEARRIVGDFTRPATLAEVSALLTRSLGDDAKRTQGKFNSFKAFLEYAVPTAEIITDRSPRWVVPEGVTPDPVFAEVLPDDDVVLMEVAASEARRIVSGFSGPATPADITARLAWSLGPKGKRAWAKPKTFKQFIAQAVPTAQILADSRHGFVVLPEAAGSTTPRDATRRL